MSALLTTSSFTALRTLLGDLAINVHEPGGSKTPGSQLLRDHHATEALLQSTMLRLRALRPVQVYPGAAS